MRALHPAIARLEGGEGTEHPSACEPRGGRAGLRARDDEIASVARPVERTGWALARVEEIGAEALVPHGKDEHPLPPAGLVHGVHRVARKVELAVEDAGDHEKLGFAQRCETGPLARV